MNKYEEPKQLFDEDFEKVDILDKSNFNKSYKLIIEEFKNIPIEIYKKTNKLWTLQQRVKDIEIKKKLLKANMKKIIAMEKDENGKTVFSSDSKISDEAIIRLDLSKEYSKLFDESSYIKMEIQAYQTKIAYLEKTFSMYYICLDKNIFKKKEEELVLPK